ncbi:MAG: GGDEF domain-containing protein [Alphaproteobacteria bacterium]|nr:GGDEF domain-containing protein [Alphaproteobacteria bacterium]
MLDASSLIVMHVSMMAAIGVVFALIVALARDWRFPWQWAAAFFVLPSVMVINGLAESTGSDLLRVLGNPVGLIGPAFVVDGLRAFVGLKPQRWIWAAGTCVLAGATALFTFALPSLEARLTVFQLLVLAIQVYFLLLLLKLPRDDHKLTRSVGLVLAILILSASAARLAATLTGAVLPAAAGIEAGIGAESGAVSVSLILLGNALAAFLALGMVLMVAERMAAKIRREAETDVLTGLATRRVFDRVLAQELERWRRYGRPLAVILFDIDHFKRINDGHGHDVGDRALQRVAECGRAAMRPTDLLARLGGDEFAVVLPETDASEAVAVAQRILDEMRAVSLIARGGAVTLSGSFGVASAHAGEEAPAGLVKRADEALYDVKRAGRNGVAARTAQAQAKAAAGD